MADILLPGPTPPISPKGISSTLFSLKPTTSALMGSLPESSLISQSSPMFTSGPLDSIVNPITFETLPVRFISSVLFITSSSCVKSGAFISNPLFPII
jgi:hypothetical protein